MGKDPENCLENIGKLENMVKNLGWDIRARMMDLQR